MIVTDLLRKLENHLCVANVTRDEDAVGRHIGSKSVCALMKDKLMASNWSFGTYTVTLLVSAAGPHFVSPV